MLTELTTDIVSAHVSRNRVAIDQMPALIRGIYDALAGLGSTVEEPVARTPAVSIRASVRPDHVVCLDCGRKAKTLRRHLRKEHGLSPSEYRERWGLATDHPIVSPDYTERRSAFARQNGLGRGRSPGKVAPKSAEPEQKVQPKRDRLGLRFGGAGAAPRR